jgi:uncharacterized protein (TIGR04141 family)
MKFVQQGVKRKIEDLINSSNSAILIIDVKNRLFAIPFGYGRFLLKDDSTEPDFGIKTTLNSLQYDSLQSIDTYTFEEQTIHYRKQASKASGLEIFDLDVSRDILQAITGKPRTNIPFEGISGKEDTLAISVRSEFEDLDSICDNLIKLYQKDDYKEHFGWVDNVKRVATSEIIKNLDGLLIKDFKKKNSTIYLSPPELLDWDKLYYFNYTRSRNELKPTLDIDTYKTTFNGDDLNVDQLKTDKAFVYNDEQTDVIYAWPIYKCLIFETLYKNGDFVLTNGSWFEIENSFAKRIKKDVQSIPIRRLGLPKVKKRIEEKDKIEIERDYNERVASSKRSFFLLDRKNVKCEYAGTSIEICDLFSKNRDFIHVKPRHGGSSAFSHLFAQGRVSAESFISDKNYRMAIKNELKSGGKTWTDLIPLDKPKTSAYNIVWAQRRSI